MEEIKKKKNDYSVVVPVYNSQDSLEELFERTKKTFDSIKANFEVIFVEDCGQDNSWKVLEEIKERNPETVTAIRLSKNFGQHNALFCGFHYAKGELIITLDDDLQIPPEEILQLIRRYKETGSDIVYGDLVEKKHSAIRNVGSEMLKNSSKKQSNKVEGTGKGSSFKLIHKDLIHKILVHSQSFIYIDELFLWYTKDISFVPVRHEKRKYGKSTYSIPKLVRLFFNISLYYTKVPLKFITYGGLIMSILSFAFAFRFIFRKIFFNVPLGYTSLIVTVLFSTSIILFSLGVIGEYINRMMAVHNKKPPYSIKKIL